MVKTIQQGALCTLFLAGILLSIHAGAATGRTDMLDDHLKREIGKRWSGARIEISGSARLLSEAPSKIEGVKITDENNRGEVRFSVWGAGQETTGSVAFQAWVPTFVALRRIHPGEKLSPDLFVVQDVNVSSGMAREYRGVMLDNGINLSSLEARQTVLEGEFPRSNGVQKVPDIRRGDSVRIRMIAGDIQLSTAGMAQEPAYIDGTVRIQTLKNKRELVGQLRSGGIVEVQL